MGSAELIGGVVGGEGLLWIDNFAVLHFSVVIQLLRANLSDRMFNYCRAEGQIFIAVGMRQYTYQSMLFGML